MFKIQSTFCNDRRIKNGCVTRDSRLPHLDALHFEDEVGNDLRDVSLVEHGVSDALQQRLHRGHTVHHDPATQEAVVELQVDQTWTHLEVDNMQANR